MREVYVVLAIRYDPEGQDHPAQWDYRELLALRPEEEVEVVPLSQSIVADAVERALYA